MRILLDTATFLWIAGDAPELSRTARSLFQDRGNDIYLSAVSAWEIAVKHALGKLPLPAPPAEIVPRLREQHGIEALALEENAALYLGLLPPIHRDPFDRMLVCQAIAHGLAVMTPDASLRKYPVRTVW